MSLTLPWLWLLSCRSQFMVLRWKSMDWFLYDRGLRREAVNLKPSWKHVFSNPIFVIIKIAYVKWEQEALFKSPLMRTKSRSSRPEMFYKKGVLRNFAKFTGKRSFPVNFAKFLRIPFLTEHLWWLLLKITKHLAPIQIISTQMLHKK